VSSALAEVSSRIRVEMDDLDQIVARARDSWHRSERVPENQDVFIDSVALNLHSFYSGLERLFEIIARNIDQSLPEGETWYRDLLSQMSEDREGQRPAVIGSDCAASLDEFRRFRHLVRSVYTMNLVPERMANLLGGLPELWATARAELLAFAEFVEDLANVNED